MFLCLFRSSVGLNQIDLLVGMFNLGLISKKFMLQTFSSLFSKEEGVLELKPTLKYLTMEDIKRRSANLHFSSLMILCEKKTKVV